SCMTLMHVRFIVARLGHQLLEGWLRCLAEAPLQLLVGGDRLRRDLWPPAGDTDAAARAGQLSLVAEGDCLVEERLGHLLRGGRAEAPLQLLAGGDRLRRLP